MLHKSSYREIKFQSMILYICQKLSRLRMAMCRTLEPLPMLGGYQLTLISSPEVN